MKLFLKAGFVAAIFGACMTLHAQATAPAGSTGQCKDGTYTTTASKSGACRGHKGIQTWYAASAAPAAKSAAAAPAPMASKPMAAAPAAAPAPAAHTAKASTSTMAQAPGGGVGTVWVNTPTKVYHCPGTQYYGKTKQGSYMSEADAKAKGYRPDANKPCK